MTFKTISIAKALNILQDVMSFVIFFSILILHFHLTVEL